MQSVRRQSADKDRVAAELRLNFRLPIARVYKPLKGRCECEEICLKNSKLRE